MNEYNRLEHFDKKHKDIMVVNWCMGNTCNFSCSYCPDDLHNGTNKWYDLEKVKNFCDKVIKHYRDKTIYFEFTGGEVTLWPKFQELCTYLKSKNVKIGFISNGSRTIRWWEEILDKVDHVCLSFHSEFGDKEHFHKVVNLCADKIRTHVNIMMKPEVFNELYELSTKLIKINNISIALQPLLINFGEKVYPYNEYQNHILNKQHELLFKHIKHKKTFDIYRGAMSMINDDLNTKINISPHQLISENKNKWKGWNCSAGLEQIVVDKDGLIYRGWCHEGGKLGHVTDDFISFPTEQIICNKNACHCNFDIMCTKEKFYEF